ncbi:MAG: tRNA (adenosine(37)-N6)-dimethylallyltransferase MiaA [Prevotella sp.]|nr:tRNA (adenosine(37)-N6)-dimethylallyltransferase MiaA [Prevotella sp.]
MITILGPTASGKTSLAVGLAYELSGEIISADSRQVYRLMDIGTGKDLKEYIIRGKSIPYHLIDIVEAGEKYNVFQYKKDFQRVYKDITKRGVIPILCGGSGLYIEAVLKDYNLVEVPENSFLRESLKDKSLEELTLILERLKKENLSKMHNLTDVDTKKRAIRAIEIETYYKEKSNLKNKAPLEIDSIVFGIDIDREERRQKISSRLKERLENGMIEEVQGLLSSGIKAEDLIYYGLEYKYVTLYLTGKLSFSEMFSSLEIAIHQFAKRQMTWFRGMQRRGTKINWLNSSMPMNEKIEAIKKMLS